MSDHPEIRGCILPLRLHYRVGDHTWVAVQDDGSVTVGMTDVAQNLAGPLLHAKVKKVGSIVARGKPLATVESSKWVGPVKAPVSGEIIAVNEALGGDAKVVNRSPYEDGWIVKMRPSQLEADLAETLTGSAALEAYRQKIEAENLKACTHIEGCEA